MAQKLRGICGSTAFLLGLLGPEPAFTRQGRSVQFAYRVPHKRGGNNMTGQEKLLCLVFVLLLVWSQMGPILSFASEIQGGVEVRMAWTPPTHRVTGEAMADSEISHYDVFCWVDDGTPGDWRYLDTVENTGNTNSGVFTDHILQFVGTCTLAGCDFFPRALVPGLNSCAISAVDTQGIASSFSDPVSFFVPPWPGSPTGLSD